MALGLASMVAAALAHAQDPARYALHVNVLGLQSNQGQLVANLFREGDDVFGKPRAKVTQVIRDKQAAVDFTSLETGRYALIVFHDVNGNHDLDHNMFHFPAEPLGYSNGFSLTLLSGMPDSHKLAFNVGPGASTIDIPVQ